MKKTSLCCSLDRIRQLSMGPRRSEDKHSQPRYAGISEPGNLETVSGWLHHPRPRGAGKPEVLVERPLRRPIEALLKINTRPPFYPGNFDPRDL